MAMEAWETRDSWELFIMRRRASVLVGFMSNMFSGLMYLFPIYTIFWQHGLGLSVTDIAIVGAFSHAGLSVAVYPLAVLHSSKVLHPRNMDRAICTFTGGLQVWAMMWVYALGEQARHATRIGKPPPGAYAQICVAMALWGAGGGGNMGHTTWVNGSNFPNKPSTKRAVVTLMFLGWATGSVLWAIVYPAISRHLSVTAWFGVQGWCYVAITLAKFCFMQRLQIPSGDDRPPRARGCRRRRRTDDELGGTELNASLLDNQHDQEQDQPRGAEEASKGWDEGLKSGGEGDDSLGFSGLAASVFNSNEGMNTIITDGSDDSSHQASDGSIEPSGGNYAQEPFSLCNVLRSDVAVMNWVVTAINIGVSSCFLSILAQMLQNTEGSAFVSETTNQATLVFLILQFVGRFVTAVVLVYADRSAELMCVWAFFVLLSCVVLKAAYSTKAIFAASALMGLGFGGTWATFGVIALLWYPNGVAHQQHNLGFTFWAVAVGSLAIGAAERNWVHSVPQTDASGTDVCAIGLLNVTNNGYGSDKYREVHAYEGADCFSECSANFTWISLTSVVVAGALFLRVHKLREGTN